MLQLIPWDVWIAVAIAIVVALAAIFESGPLFFIAVYVALCGYVIVETIGMAR